MTFFLNRKLDYSIPVDSDSDKDNDMYLDDPDLRYDRLPQPFHFINKIVKKIITNVLVHVEENDKRRLAYLKKRALQNYHPVSTIKNLGNIQCMSIVSSDSNYLVVGFKNSLGIIDILTGSFVDRWENDDLDIVSISCEALNENVYILAIIDNNGSARLVALTQNKMFNLKTFSCNKDGDKPCQITSLFLDKNCGFIALSFDQFKENDQWVEIHKLNREAWIREISAVGKDDQDQSFLHHAGAEEPSPSPDRSVIRVSGTNLIMKLKYPDTSSINTNMSSLTQLYKQIDTTGSTIGLGLNSCLSTDYNEKMHSVFIKDNPYLIDCMDQSNSTDSYLMRIANVRFSPLVGLRDLNRAEISEKESSVIFVWWSQSQHLLTYEMNKTGQKSGNDLWIKPDAVRSFSCEITACELSSSKCFLGVGLRNGVFILIDMLTGLTRSVKQICDSSISSLFPINFDNGTPAPNGPCQTDGSQVSFAIIDANSGMFCLKFNSSILINDSASVLVSKDANVDSISRISNMFDLALTVIQSNVVNICDLATNMNLVQLCLPEDTILSAPWQPIFAFMDRTGYFCMQVMNNSNTHPEEPQTEQPILAIYKLELEEFRQEMPQKISDCFTSYIDQNVVDLLQTRLKNHEQRQLALQESWKNLDNVLKSLL